MIFAMHQTKVACLVRHGTGSNWQRIADGFAWRAKQLLLASSTTEGQNGGNIRSSAAAVERTGTNISLVRNATVISYGEQADGIVTIARRASDAAASDQVLVAFTRADYTLERSLEWETLGMRGTCSAGFELKATGSAEQIFPEAYDRNSRADDDTGRPSLLGIGRAGIAAGGSRSSPTVRPQSRSRFRRPDAARCSPLYRRKDVAG